MVQLDRTSDSGSGGWRFESSWAYNFIYKIVKIFVIFASLFNLILDKKKELINDHEEEKTLKKRD